MPMAMLRGKSRTEIRRPMTVCHTGLSKLWTPVGGHRLAAAGGLVDVVDRGVKCGLTFHRHQLMETPIRHYQPGNLNSKAATMRLRAQC
jgi:hypothetical protein